MVDQYYKYCKGWTNCFWDTTHNLWTKVPAHVCARAQVHIHAHTHSRTQAHQNQGPTGTCVCWFGPEGKVGRLTCVCGRRFFVLRVSPKSTVVADPCRESSTKGAGEGGENCRETCQAAGDAAEDRGGETEEEGGERKGEGQLEKIEMWGRLAWDGCTDLQVEEDITNRAANHYALGVIYRASVDCITPMIKLLCQKIKVLKRSFSCICVQVSRRRESIRNWHFLVVVPQPVSLYFKEAVQS